MRITNAILILVASAVYVVFVLVGGRTSINGGLGPDGSVFYAMAINHNVQAGSAVDKLTPAFPLAVAVAYSITGNAVASFLLVNVIAFGVLTWAMCWILDRRPASVSLKVAGAITLVLLGVPSRTTSFAPGQPHLLALAAILLAVAAAERSAGAFTALLSAAAVAT